MTAPTVLPGRTSERLSRKSRLLYHWRADRFDLNPLTGQTVALTRATPGGLVLDANGKFRDVGQHQPRFKLCDANGDGVYERPALMIESARINRATFWEDFSDAAHNKQNVTIASDAIRAPGAVGRADKFVEDAVNAIHRVDRSFAVTAGEKLAYGCCFKAAGRSAVRLIVHSNAGANDFEADFNLTTGAVTPGTSSGTGIRQNAYCEPLGGGWYWCEIGGTVDPAAVSATAQIFMLTAVGGSSTYLGDGASGVYAWGLSFRRGATFIGSPIAAPAGSEVTSNADSNTMAVAIDTQRHRSLTAYVEMPRPSWIDATGAKQTAVLSNRVFCLRNGNNRVNIYGEHATLGFTAQASDGVASAGRTLAYVAGSMGPVIRLCAQYRNLHSGADVTLDIGNGFTTFSSIGPALPMVFDTMELGHFSGAHYIEGGLFCVKLASGLYTRDEMQALF